MNGISSQVPHKSYFLRPFSGAPVGSVGKSPAVARAPVHGGDQVSLGSVQTTSLPEPPLQAKALPGQAPETLPSPATATFVNGPLITLEEPGALGSVSLAEPKQTPEQNYFQSADDFVRAYEKGNARALVDLFLEPGYLLPAERKPDVSPKDELNSFLLDLDRAVGQSSSKASTTQEKSQLEEFQKKTRALLKASRELPSNQLPSPLAQSSFDTNDRDLAIAQLSKGERRNIDGNLKNGVISTAQKFERIGIPVNKEWLTASRLQDHAVRQIQGLDREIASRNGAPEEPIPGLESAEVSKSKWSAVLAANTMTLRSLNGN